MITGVFDIETTGLNPAFDHVLCASMGTWHPELGATDIVTLRLDDLEYRPVNVVDDTALVKAIIRQMNKYHHLVSWNGKRFDVRFLKARALLNGVADMFRGRMFHTDAMNHWRAHFGTRGSRLEMVSRVLQTPGSKTPLDERTWALAGVLDKGAMDMVVAHCEADIAVLGQVYTRIIPFLNSITRQS